MEFTIIFIKLFLLVKLNLHQNVKKETVIMKVPSEFLSKKSDTRLPVVVKTYLVDRKLMKKPKKQKSIIQINVNEKSFIFYHIFLQNNLECDNQ